MKILFIAPLPPPIHGQSLASKVFLDEIGGTHEVMVVNTAKRKDAGIRATFRRAFEVAGFLAGIMRKARAADVAYLTISESRAGNLKDLLTYLLCLARLDRMVIHLHGGAGMIRIMREGNGWLARANAFFLRRLKGVVILGESHRRIFEGAVMPERIHVVPNFAQDELFIDEAGLLAKSRPGGKIRFLFLSNLLPGKGYVELLDAWLGLPPGIRSRCELAFAGAFDSEAAKRLFLDRIRGLDDVTYHGVVAGAEKRRLFASSRVFCLPTYYPYEGQPISILEAYASGCAVITTNHSGIRDVFTDGINGFEVPIRSAGSIRSAIERIASDPAVLAPIAAANLRTAGECYRASIYNQSLRRIVGV